MPEYGIPLRRDLAAAFRRLNPDVVITGFTGLGAGCDYAVGFRRYPMG